MTQDQLLLIQILKNYVDELHEIDEQIKQLQIRREEVLTLKRELMFELKDLKEKDYLDNNAKCNSLVVGD